MDRKLITKIALGISLAALVFSAVTFIRSLVLGSGVLPSLLLVVTTGMVVAVCALMMRTMAGYDDDYYDGLPDYEDTEDEAEEAEAEEGPIRPADPPADERAADEEISSDSIERQVDDLISELEKEGRYDLTNFE